MMSELCLKSVQMRLLTQGGGAYTQCCYYYNYTSYNTVAQTEVESSILLSVSLSLHVCFFFFLHLTKNLHLTNVQFLSHFPGVMYK